MSDDFRLADTDDSDFLGFEMLLDEDDRKLLDQRAGS